MTGRISITERFENGYLNIRVMAGRYTEGPEIENIPGFRRRILYTSSDDIILLERWAANQYGTVLSEMISFQGRGQGTIPEVDCPVEILMYLRTWAVTKRFYPVFDEIREKGVWLQLSPVWWRLCDLRINTNQPAPPLDAEFLSRCASTTASRSSS